MQTSARSPNDHATSSTSREFDLIHAHGRPRQSHSNAARHVVTHQLVMLSALRRLFLMKGCDQHRQEGSVHASAAQRQIGQSAAS